MIKRLFEFTGDVFLFSLLLGIIGTAVFAVFSLSPLTAENLGYTKSTSENGVLGTNSSDKKLIISTNYESNQFFIIENDNSSNFLQRLKIGPMNAEKYKKQIFTIENPDRNARQFKISMKIAEEYVAIANIGIEYFGDEYFLLETNGAVNALNGTIEPNSTADFYFLIDPTVRINYPIEVEILVEETIQTFEFPE